jgi:diguanylate cyclase (GGDEF)-like protein/PAS domain S-box-containing protein
VKLVGFLPIEQSAQSCADAMPPFNDPDICRDILDGLQIGVSVLDLQKKIVFWSDGAEQITGYSRIDVLGHSCVNNILQHCNENSCEMCTDRCPLSAAMHDAKPMEAMTFIHHKSGHRTQVHTWAIPLRDKHGSLIGVIQTFEGEFALGSPGPDDRGMRERGCLDETTELPNEAMMQAHLRELLGTFGELQISFAVICLEVSDLSNFRTRYGQVAARSILRVLARTLRNTVWPTDFVGRWSDDRFLLILSGCRYDALHVVSQRILNMASSATIHWWGEELSVTVSIGATVAVAGDNLDSLLRRAQQGLPGNPVSAPVRAALAVTTSLSKNSTS